MARTPISTLAQFAPCTINIKGKVAYSRLASRIDGQELAIQNQQAAQSGRPQHSKPYVFITINNPVIVDNGTLAPQVKNVISERFFQRKDGTWAFTQESKSPFLPTILYGPEAGDLKGQGIADDKVPLQAEFAQGLDVTVGVDLFVMKGAQFNNVGLGIKYILVNEPVKYYSRNSIDADLAAMGMTYTAPVASATAPVTPVANAFAQPAQQTFVQPSAPAPQQYVAPSAPAPQQFQQPQYAAPAQTQYQAPWNEDDLPFDRAPVMQAAGVEQQIQRPVRYF